MDIGVIINSFISLIPKHLIIPRLFINLKKFDEQNQQKTMSNYVEQAQDLEKKAEKKLSGWGLFGNKQEDAADLYDKAANYYKLAKSWDQAGAVYLKLANCHLKLDSKHEAANAYTEAGHAYKKTSVKEAASCLEQSVNCFLEIGRLSMAARYCKEIAELHEGEQNLDQAILWYEKAADLFQSEEVSGSANQCRQKIAQYAAQLEQYPKAIEIYEDIARQTLDNTLLKFSVKGHLLNAGICHLCKGDTVSITNALDKYQDMDPTFTGTREYRLLSDLASAVDEQDVGKFTDVLKEFDSMTPLDAWKTTLFLRVKDKLKAQDNDDDDLT